MSGNEKFLVPEAFAFALGQKPPSFKYKDPKVERFAGAKRGGSPNLAKLSNYCRFMDGKENWKKLGFEEPEQEFIDWMEYEEENGFMWNEQGPSINYDWMHLLPTLGYAIYGGPMAAKMANEWIIQYLKALDFGYYDDVIAQVGMRGANHPEGSGGFNEWLLHFCRTGKIEHPKYGTFKSNLLRKFIVEKTGDLLQRLYAAEPDHWWPVRVEQAWYRFEGGCIAILSKDGNGNTQARGGHIVAGKPNHSVALPKNGFRKQGFLDKMDCHYDKKDSLVFYRSELFTSNKTEAYNVSYLGRLLWEKVWNKNGLKTIDHADPFMPVPEGPASEIPKPPKTGKDRPTWIEKMGL